MSSPNGDKQVDSAPAVQSDQQYHHGQSPQQASNGGPSQPTGAAAAAQQPKVVQTAFIHKLYKYAFPA